jgi:hypothetical protein
MMVSVITREEVQKESESSLVDVIIHFSLEL